MYFASGAEIPVTWSPKKTKFCAVVQNLTRIMGTLLEDGCASFIMLHSSRNEKCLRQKLCREIQHTHCIFSGFLLRVVLCMR